LSLAGGLCLLACSPGGPRIGVTVESVGPHGAGAQAGLRKGDVLLSWQRRGAGGAFRSCTDLAAVDLEEAPREPVTVRVRRQRQDLTLKMPAGEWQVEALSAKDGEEGCAAFSRARRLARENEWRQAQAAFAEAAQAARAQKRTLFAALALQEQGRAALALNDFPVAEKVFTEALRLRRETAPGSLAEAASWHMLGRLDQIRGAVASSEAAFQKALGLRQSLAPRSLDTASTLNNLGIDAWKRSDLDTAQAFYLQALTLIRALAPGGNDEGRVLNNLGMIARERGDLDAAEGYLLRSEQIWQRIAPGSEDIARSEVNLGTVASDRGDSALSDEYQRKALARFEKIMPDSLVVAKILNNLAINAGDRADLDEAEALAQRALAICHRLYPDTDEEATSLSNLSWIAQERGRLDEAESFARRALAIRSRQAPSSPAVALSLGMLGAIAAKQGDYRRATGLGEQALDLQRRVAPGSFREAELLLLLADIALEQGDAVRAEALDRQALAIRRRLAPRSSLEGQALARVARAVQEQGRLREAEILFEQAVDAVEAQIGRLDSMDDERSGLQPQLDTIYRQRIALQVRRGEPAAALHTLERSRARTLLALLAQRDLHFGGDAPADLLASQRLLDRKYESVQESIGRLDPRRTAEIDSLVAVLVRLRRERSVLSARIARASPRYASLRAPQPLDLAGIRAGLDPGTVWLSYAVDDEQTYLFVVPAPGRAAGAPVQVHTLPIGRLALAEEVAVFRSLILRGHQKDGAGGEPVWQPEPVLLDAARRLYALLIAPAAAEIAGADRILLSPDGPLHLLPFAALVHGDPPVFLAEEKPLHSVLSATLYAELRRGRRPSPTAVGPLVAFADPSVRPPAAGSRDDPAEPPMRRYSRGLARLPGARAEARALAELWGTDAHIYVGAAATEQRLRELPVRPRYLHFACHALLDRRFPLDSALALAAPAHPGNGDNGLLQAWEIFERLRLDTDLVTLSACETGLGRDAGGEGLIGLTRAFQFAGARSILASLWAVSDGTTAELMERFYALLRAGRPKDLALQEAQRELLHSRGGAAHPVHWAAFTLSGDWR
jgi:CHAT domain-containing protein/tetratricopeptide (TPR) repeat protein